LRVRGTGHPNSIGNCHPTTFNPTWPDTPRRGSVATMTISRPVHIVLRMILAAAIICACVMLLAHIAMNTTDGVYGQTVAAWFQAVGSIAAIGAAIWISHGEARRAEAAAEAARMRDLAIHAEAVGDWRQAFADSLQAMENARRLAERPVDGIDGYRLIRLLKNTKGMIETYLALPPPNPSLSFLLIAARMEVDAPMPALESFQADASETSAKRLRATLDRSLFHLREMQEEYEQGVL